MVCHRPISEICLPVNGLQAFSLYFFITMLEKSEGVSAFDSTVVMSYNMVIWIA